MTTTGTVDIANSPNTENWTYEYLVDKVFFNLMQNGVNYETKSNKYIIQFVNKFEYFRIRSSSTFFEIDIKDLSEDTIKQIEDHTKDCKTVEEKYRKLDGVIVETIARICKQAEPIILSSKTNDDSEVLLKVALNEIREIVSFRWRFVDGDKEAVYKNE